jgi:outer membrane protein assembly factor BamB
MNLIRTFALIASFHLAAHPVAAVTANWPQFRGSQANGLSDDPVPITWNVESGENVLWQTAVPGLGHASPIVWEDRVYVATAVKASGKAELKIGLYGSGKSYTEKEPHQWRLLCFDRQSGKTLWDKLGHEAVPRQERHTKATHCNSTPATDGRRIVAIFGSEGLFCFDMTGERLWHKDLGKMDAGPYNDRTLQWSFASSPVLHQDRVIVQCDVNSEQFLAMFDARDGRQLWRVSRDEAGGTWCTPAVAARDGGQQILVNGWKHIGGFDFDTGRSLWRLEGGGDIPVPTPVVAHGLVFLTSAHGKFRPMRAVRLDATGDITPPDISETNKHVAWCHPRQGSYMQTPIVVSTLLFSVDSVGALTCFDARTGKIHYTERLSSGSQGFTASPVAADGKLYVTGEQGDVFVVPAIDKFSVLATNKLGDICLSTPALSRGTAFFRTGEKLIAIGAVRR